MTSSLNVKIFLPVSSIEAMSGININFGRVEYLTCDIHHARIAQEFVAKLHFDADLTAPALFGTQFISTPFDLFLRIDRLFSGHSQEISVIIDYQSILNLKDKSQRKDYFSVIRDTVLCFPEVGFFFDETVWEKNPCSVSDFFEKVSMGSKIFKDFSGDVDFSLHSFRFLPERREILPYVDIQEESVCFNENKYRQDQEEKWNPLKFILLGRKNLFDASNLRCLFKRHKAEELNLKQNFFDMQNSRFSNLALCVEEERGQSMFNSLALFLNGFRVRPITSSYELKQVNQNSSGKNTPKLILRDYDLQFPDAPAESSDIKNARLWNFDSSAPKPRSVLHCLRESIKIRNLKEKGWNPIKAFREEFNRNTLWHFQKDSDYWSNLSEVATCFVSKGFQDREGRTRLFFKLPVKQPISEIKERLDHCLVLPGLNKPVSGLYSPFHKIPLIEETFRKVQTEESNHPIITKRTSTEGHSVPLDLYNLANNMVGRAEAYYDESRFVHAVIVANEAIEIMNGFHQALSLRAYRCQALAENAVAANVLGTDENDLAIDTDFRLKRIISQVLRLSSLGDEKGRKSQNTLNQVFNDIRLFCQEKEHFLAENVVIREIGHLNEGLFFKRR